MLSRGPPAPQTRDGPRTVLTAATSTPQTKNSLDTAPSSSWPCIDWGQARKWLEALSGFIPNRAEPGILLTLHCEQGQGRDTAPRSHYPCSDTTHHSSSDWPYTSEGQSPGTAHSSHLRYTNQEPASGEGVLQGRVLLALTPSHMVQPLL